MEELKQYCTDKQHCASRTLRKQHAKTNMLWVVYLLHHFILAILTRRCSYVPNCRGGFGIGRELETLEEI